MITVGKQLEWVVTVGYEGYGGIWSDGAQPRPWSFRSSLETRDTQRWGGAAPVTLLEGFLRLLLLRNLSTLLIQLNFQQSAYFIYY